MCCTFFQESKTCKYSSLRFLAAVHVRFWERFQGALSDSRNTYRDRYKYLTVLLLHLPNADSDSQQYPTWCDMKIYTCAILHYVRWIVCRFIFYVNLPNKQKQTRKQNMHTNISWCSGTFCLAILPYSDKFLKFPCLFWAASLMVPEERKNKAKFCLCKCNISLCPCRCPGCYSQQ